METIVADIAIVQALQRSETIETLVEHRIFNTMRPEYDEQEDKIPYIVVTYEGMTNDNDNKDSIEGDEDVERVNVLIVAQDRVQLSNIINDYYAKDISKKLGVSRLSFGTAEHMEQLLHISPGAVSPMGLLFESAKDIRLVLDEDLLKAENLGCHPCVNTASIRLSMQDFLQKYLPATGHTPTFVSIPASYEE